MTTIGINLLPEWLHETFKRASHQTFPSMQERAAFVIELSRLNSAYATGGPFGAAVFNMATWQLISVGVNRVVPLNASVAHAEMVALTLAQQALHHFDLGAKELPACELVTSTEPCAMCFGAIPWSGIRQLVCCAEGADAERIGFDEGPKHPNWIAELERRNIHVITQICRAEAAKVLDDYHTTQGLIYNARQG